MSEVPRLRIGELSRRLGVTPELLRAWETRYELVSPERTAGGLRLYTSVDERRVRLMQENIASGLSAAEAARLAKSAVPIGSGATVGELAERLENSFDALDEPGAQQALDALFQDRKLKEALARVILPFLNGVGERWSQGQMSVAHEHFASQVLGGRLRALARDWGDGSGPCALLACPPRELHDLGLVCFGLALREGGWRVAYLGADTPLEEVARAREELEPEIVVLSAVVPERFTAVEAQIAALVQAGRVGLGGAGASAVLAERLGAELLPGALLEAAAQLHA